MPELPEVEILARHLRPLLVGRTIRDIEIRRPEVLAPTPAAQLKRRLAGAKFLGLTRRGKYLLFALRARGGGPDFTLLGHLGMTGRMFLAEKGEPPTKHAAVILDLGRRNFIYDDVRYFGRFTLDLSPVERLGPEPLAAGFTAEGFGRALKRSRQAVKVKLLDQSLVAGVGNIYASESLFRAGISPRRAADRLTRAEVAKLWRAIRAVLRAAIGWGSTVPLNFQAHDGDGLFYYGSAVGQGDFGTERLRVYDRAGQPCVKCETPVQRIVQAARSTFFCPHCQRA
jgi:formamidopyrimidine-DNA glycosylase